MAMARHVPWIEQDRFAALPPGCADGVPPRRPGARLRLLYVGGLGEHYRMHALVRALHDLPQVELVICTRATEWDAKRHEYPLPAAGNVRVEHRSGEQLVELFEQADVGVICIEPQPYWEFAAPLKLYEYLGVERPVIASEGTLAGDFTTSEGIGWSVPYDASQIAALLSRLAADRSCSTTEALHGASSRSTPGKRARAKWPTT